MNDVISKKKSEIQNAFKILKIGNEPSSFKDIQIQYKKLVKNNTKPIKNNKKHH